MAFAIELFFDCASTSQIMDTWTNLSEQGTGSYLIDSGSQPHITLAVFNTLDVNNISSYLNQVSQDMGVFSLHLNSVGTFLTDEGTVFLAPVVTEKLLYIHRIIHELTNEYDEKKWDYYLPGKWVPHCTMATNNSKEFGIKALEIIKERFRPMDVIIERIGLVEFRPIKKHSEFTLSNHN
ncbi:2'-5' RNA ligase family protein [Paenibacillus qinlingensis]|uniref:2'-5' RNA ligase n=1 Tax=Paenibacillus qinlingensis TaxID=1837343 RepID=A0ABU1NWM3_9BACL|nr:2'-5' RNA ligase family protein [Paenibacillus qinlingensis]MDR6551879.1 2'-5' RNA ligase [Paenibacillus qinlingensis]